MMSELARMISKEEARYRPREGKKRCAACTMFRAPSSCTLVKGRISPDGLCDYFEPKRMP